MSARSAILAGAVLLAAAAAAPASAVEYPWCAQYGHMGGFGGFHEGGRNCGFTTYAQCMATVSGVGGFCERNSFYKGAEPANRKRREAR